MTSVALGLRERFWLRVVRFAIRRANRAGGLHRGMTKYHWTSPAPPDIDPTPVGALNDWDF